MAEHINSLAKTSMSFLLTEALVLPGCRKLHLYYTDFLRYLLSFFVIVFRCDKADDGLEEWKRARWKCGVKKAFEYQKAFLCVVFSNPRERK